MFGYIYGSVLDFIDGKVARKYNMVTDFGKMIDAISDKILTNTLIVVITNIVNIILAYTITNSKFEPQSSMNMTNTKINIIDFACNFTNARSFISNPFIHFHLSP